MTFPLQRAGNSNRNRPWLRGLLLGLAIVISSKELGCSQGSSPLSVQLSGINALFGKKQAMLIVNEPGVPEKSIILAEGEKSGAIELVQVDTAFGKVKIKNAGIERTLSLASSPVSPRPVIMATPLPQQTTVPSRSPIARPVAAAPAVEESAPEALDEAEVIAPQNGVIIMGKKEKRSFKNTAKTSSAVMPPPFAPYYNPQPSSQPNAQTLPPGYTTVTPAGPEVATFNSPKLEQPDLTPVKTYTTPFMPKIEQPSWSFPTKPPATTGRESSTLSAGASDVSQQWVKQDPKAASIWLQNPQKPR